MKSRNAILFVCEIYLVNEKCEDDFRGDSVRIEKTLCIVKLVKKTPSWMSSPLE